MEQKVNALVLHASDHVAVALEELKPGDEAVYGLEGKRISVKVLDSIPIYHKLCIVPIAEGARVYKYGQVIGKATERIQAGRHVHTHNLVSIREGVGTAEGKGYGV